MSKALRKREWAREQEKQGRRVYGERPAPRYDRPVLFTSWSAVLKARRNHIREPRRIITSEAVTLPFFTRIWLAFWKLFRRTR